MADFQLSDDERKVPEGKTPHFWMTMKDPDTGSAIALSVLDTLTLSLWYGDENGGKKINSRDGQDVKNANNVTFNATSGLLDWYLQSADTTMQSLDPGLFTEEHFFEFEWSYTAASGTRKGSYKDKFLILRSPDVR